jgi:hypothetical protein
LCFDRRAIKNESSIRETAKEIKMKSFESPSATSAKSDLVKYLESVGSSGLDAQGRVDVERNVLGPLILLVESIQLARATGPIEEELFFHFVRDLSAQWDHTRRAKGIERLISGLQRLHPDLPNTV